MENINKKKISGTFITFEGIEGAGKTSLIKFFANYLRKKNIEVVVTREPGGTIFSEKLRNLLLFFDKEKINPYAELLLFLSSRAQHINELILPALNSGKIVLCDRFNDATIAYQAGGRKIPENNILKLIELSNCDLIPDYTILLDIPVDIGMKRIKNRISFNDRIEKERKIFFEDIRKKYLEIARKNNNRFFIVDSSIECKKLKQIIKKFIEIKILLTNQ